MDCAVVIISFDGYKDVWETFFKCYSRFWKNNYYRTYLITNYEKPDFRGVKCITTGTEKSWSHRVRSALEQIEEEYLLILLEDYFLCEEITSRRVTELFEECKKGDYDYLRIVPIPYEHRKKKKGIYQLDDAFLYGVNLQAAIWKKIYLKELLYKDDFSAWEFEARQKKQSDLKIFGKCMTLNYVGISYLNGIIQGKWNPRTIKRLSRFGITVKTGTRQALSVYDLLIMEGKNWLLHSIPPRVIEEVKPILTRLGMKFVT